MKETLAYLHTSAHELRSMIEDLEGKPMEVKIEVEWSCEDEGHDHDHDND